MVANSQELRRICEVPQLACDVAPNPGQVQVIADFPILVEPAERLADAMSAVAAGEGVAIWLPAPKYGEEKASLSTTPTPIAGTSNSAYPQTPTRHIRLDRRFPRRTHRRRLCDVHALGASAIVAVGGAMIARKRRTDRQTCCRNEHL